MHLPSPPRYTRSRRSIVFVSVLCASIIIIASHTMTAQNSLKMETMFVRCYFIDQNVPTYIQNTQGEWDAYKQFPCRRAKSLWSPCSHTHTDTDTSNHIAIVVVSLLSFIIQVLDFIIHLENVKMWSIARHQIPSQAAALALVKSFHFPSSLSPAYIRSELPSPIYTICMSSSSSSLSLSERRLD